MKQRQGTLIIIGVLIIVLLFFLQTRLHVEIQTSISSENNMVSVDVSTYKGSHLIDADNVEIKIFNKYKKDESIEEALTSYEEGKYSIAYYPPYSGTYMINLNVKIGDKVLYKEKTLEI